MSAAPEVLANVKSRFEVVAIAASVGGLPALRAVLAVLPAEFPCAIIVIQHRTPEQETSGIFVDLLKRRCALPVREASHEEQLVPGTVFLAPARRNLIVDQNRSLHIVPSIGHPHNASAADKTLISLATIFRKHLIAVILTGSNRDGATGVAAVKAAGGRVLIQDAESAMSFGMPGAALCTGCVDFILPVNKIGPALVAFTMHNGAADLFRVPVPHWAHLD